MVKQKLKQLEMEIKDWNKNSFGNLDNNISKAIEGIKAMDDKGGKGLC